MHISHRTIVPEHAECRNLYEGGSSRVRINCSKHPRITVVTQENCMACVCGGGGAWCWGGGGGGGGGDKITFTRPQSGFSMGGMLNSAYMHGGTMIC